jgi:hypothetical protein
VHPHSPGERLRWVEGALRSLTREVASLRARLRAVAAPPPALDADERAPAEVLRGELAVLERECALLAAQLAPLSAPDEADEA